MISCGMAFAVQEHTGMAHTGQYQHLTLDKKQTKARQLSD